MESDSETEDSIAIARTYDKMKTSVHKIGFVEGLTSGKEASFQSGFDNGYEEGFKNGFQLGKLNGVLSVLHERSRIDKTVAEEIRNIPMEQNTKRGMCVLCKTENRDLQHENSSSSESNSLETSIKHQEETIANAMCIHLTKLKLKVAGNNYVLVPGQNALGPEKEFLITCLSLVRPNNRFPNDFFLDCTSELLKKRKVLTKCRFFPLLKINRPIFGDFSYLISLIDAKVTILESY